MSKEKDYDSTLARMAGNIAAGIIGSKYANSSDLQTAERAVNIAKHIRDLCKGEK